MKKMVVLIIFVLVSNSIVCSQEFNLGNDLGKSSSSSKIYESDANERIFTSGIIFLEVVILVMVLYYWKKTHSDLKKNVETTYKRNIKAIRDERVKPIFNKEISKKRKAINKLIEIKELNSRNISKKARVFDIAKGELYLAAKIHSLTQQVK